MIGTQDRWQGTLFVTGSLDKLIPSDHILKRVDKVLDLSWLREEVREDYCETNGRPVCVHRTGRHAQKVLEENEGEKSISKKPGRPRTRQSVPPSAKCGRCVLWTGTRP